MAVPATSEDVQRLLGEVDPLIVERILATRASADEIDEALRELEDERGFGETTHAASSKRVTEVRTLLDEHDVLRGDRVEPEVGIREESP